MIRYTSNKQLSLAEFDWPFQTALDENNRWVKLSQIVPWDELAESYYQAFTSQRGRPTKDARLVIGAVIIKHKLCLSDRETVAQIQENPYLQYFVGLPGYQMESPFAPSLFVEIRKRMGAPLFDDFHAAVVERIEKGPSGSKKRKDKANPADNDKAAEKAASTPEQISGDELPALPQSEDATEPEAASEETEAPERQGKLILDATVAPQAIRYPTDLSLLNEARELTEKIIDHLYPHTDLKAKPRTYRQKARKAYLAIAKQKRPTAKVRRKGIKQQLQYLRRNLKHIEGLLEHWPQGQPIPLPRWLLYRYWVIQHLYAQQWDMYRNRCHRCDDRIVSISQPYVRPIVRGKLDKPVEFGAKLSVSLNDEGIACVDEIRWDAFHEGQDLVSQVEAYKARHGDYPAVVLADPAYGSRANRRYLKQHGIRFGGKPLGRPKKETDENRDALKKEKAQRQADYRQRIPIEGKFGQGKKGYGLGYIEAKRADTSVAWINSIFLVMNLMVLLRIFFALDKFILTGKLWRLPGDKGLLWIQVSQVLCWFRYSSSAGCRSAFDY